MRGREKRAVLVMSLVVVCVGVAAAVRGNELSQEIRQNSLRESALEQQLEEETQRTQEIQDLEQYMQSDEYIEKQRERSWGF